MAAIRLTDYRSLAELRYQIRAFLAFSEQAARDAGLEPQQHQLLLAVKGLPADRRPTIGVLAERMQLRHHSTVELVDRLVEHGLVERARGEDDRREVLVRLTSAAEQVLEDLSVAHRAQLRRMGPALAGALGGVLGREGRSNAPAVAVRKAATRRSTSRS